MKPLARRFARLYPKPWRLRYGGEFDALLEDTHVTWRDLLDVVAGALQAQIRYLLGGEGRNTRMENSSTFTRVIDYQQRRLAQGFEAEAVMEYTLSDGSKSIRRQFWRELDLGDTYVNLSHMSRDGMPAQTILVSGKKGEVEGDFRTDRTEMLVLQPDGTVQRTEQTVKTYLKLENIRPKIWERFEEGRKAGLSPDEILETLRRERESRE